MYPSRYEIQEENDLRSLHASLHAIDDPQQLDLIGIYTLVGTAAMTYRRLVLHGHRNFAVYEWMDLGGGFMQWSQGTFHVNGDVLFTPGGKYDWPLGPFWIGRDPETGRRLLTPFGRSITAGGRDIYGQAIFPEVRRCISMADGKYNFQNSITPGKHYWVVGLHEANGYLIVLNDHGRKRKYPAAIFEKVHVDITPIDRILSKLKQSDRVKMNPPATIQELQEFEKFLGTKLPQDFVQFYLCCNGLEGNWEDLFRMLPLKEMTQNPDMLHGKTLGFAECLNYIETWCLHLNPEIPNKYKISNGYPSLRKPFVELTNSLSAFLFRYLNGGGVFGADGLYAWSDDRFGTNV